MVDPDPDPYSSPEALPLSLPPIAAVASLHATHPDSEDAVRLDRHRTAQELRPIPQGYLSASHASGPRTPSPPWLESVRRRASQAGTVPDEPAPGELQRHAPKRQRAPGWHEVLLKFWRKNVSVVVDEGALRDHLALERTFLGYLRTSLALASTGVITAQLFRLQHSPSPSPIIGYYAFGVPLAATFIVSAMVVLLVGAWRFWRQQAAMIRGKVFAGGWEITGIMVLSLLVSMLLFLMASL